MSERQTDALESWPAAPHPGFDPPISCPSCATYLTSKKKKFEFHFSYESSWFEYKSSETWGSYISCHHPNHWHTRKKFKILSKINRIENKRLPCICSISPAWVSQLIDLFLVVWQLSKNISKGKTCIKFLPFSFLVLNSGYCIKGISEHLLCIWAWS